MQVALPDILYILVLQLGLISNLNRSVLSTLTSEDLTSVAQTVRQFDNSRPMGDAQQQPYRQQHQPQRQYAHYGEEDDWTTDPILEDEIQQTTSLSLTECEDPNSANSVLDYDSYGGFFTGGRSRGRGRHPFRGRGRRNHGPLPAAAGG